MPVLWSVVIPVKSLLVAKSRISVTDPEQRIELARAMALDTIEAACACPVVDQVVVVTDEAEIGATAAELGATVVSDAPQAGLDAAVSHGASVARQLHAQSAVAVVAADLPALRPEELGLALAAASELPRAAVADAGGSGTVLLTANAGVELLPAYGEGSLARHERSGAVVLDLPTPGLHHDVDTVADLRVALRLGCGPRTTAVAAALLSQIAP